MKRKTWIVLPTFLALFVAGSHGAQSLQDTPVGWTQVAISYAELKRLWEKAEAPDEPESPEPPVAALLGEAVYDLHVGANETQLEATDKVVSFASGWNAVPLIGGDVRLSATDSGNHRILWMDKGYHLLLKDEESVELKLTFALPGPDRWPASGIQLKPAAATVNRLRVAEMAEGWQLAMSEASFSVDESGGAVYHLSNQRPEVTLALEAYRPPPPPPPPPPAPIKASEWTVQSEVFAGFEAETIHYEARVFCKAKNGSALSLDLHVPRNARSVEISGDDVAQFRLGTRGDAHREVHVSWKSRDIFDRVLLVSYQIAQSPLEQEWTLIAPQPAEGETLESLFVMPRVAGLDLTGTGVVEPAGNQRTPGWM